MAKKYHTVKFSDKEIETIKESLIEEYSREEINLERIIKDREKVISTTLFDRNQKRCISKLSRIRKLLKYFDKILEK